MIEAYFFS